MPVEVLSLGVIMERSLTASVFTSGSQCDSSTPLTVEIVFQIQAETRKLLKSYRKHLLEQDLSINTRIAYCYAVSGFLRWIGGHLNGCFDESSPFANCAARDRAVSEYKLTLRKKGAKRASINAALTGVDHFYQFLGLGKSSVSRE